MLSIATVNRRRPSRISLRFDRWTSIAVSRKTPSASAIRPISSLRSRPGTSIDVSPAARPLIAAVMLSIGLTTRGTTNSTAITTAPTTLRVVMRRSRSRPLRMAWAVWTAAASLLFWAVRTSSATSLPRPRTSELLACKDA